MYFKNSLALVILVLISASCNHLDNQKNNTNHTKADSTEYWLQKIHEDSTDKNILQAIAEIDNDSIRNELIHLRRKMLINYESFQKLQIDANEFIQQNPCYAPLIKKIDRIHDKAFSWTTLFNETFPLDDYRSKRYVVGDFNTIDLSGQCKGCAEQYPNIYDLPELRQFLVNAHHESLNLYNDDSIVKWVTTQHTELKEASRLWKNLRDHVEKYRTEPMQKPPIVEVYGRKYCIGQSLCLCEIRDDTIVTVAKFVTSSKNALASQHNQHDFDGQPRYYAPMNRLSSRYWDDAVKYDSLDYWHDDQMGFSSKAVILYQGKVKLPNFMHITPDDAYPGAKGFVNGIHEFAVGGSEPGKFMGSPMSLGCVRLHDYPSKFIRWWTPAQAKMFIHYEHSRYIQTVKQPALKPTN